MRNLKSPVVAAIASAALTASVVGGVAIAQTSGEIMACVAENSGNVRIVTSEDDCKPNENATKWNQQGPMGPAGADGTDGATNVRTRGSSLVQVAPGETGFAEALCERGEKATGGGGGSPMRGAVMRVSIPSYYIYGNNTPAGWLVEYENPTGNAVSIYAHVICASP